MNEAQKRAIKIALNFTRDRISVPSRGAIDYADVIKQIEALPDIEHIRELVKWTLAYERHDQDTTLPPMKPKDYEQWRIDSNQ